MGSSQTALGVPIHQIMSTDRILQEGTCSLGDTTENHHNTLSQMMSNVQPTHHARSELKQMVSKVKAFA
jgi:hypothetical protein